MSPTTNQHRTSDNHSDPLISQLSAHAKFKDRSNATHDNDHAPVLADGQHIACLLLGDSMFERFKTTGHATHFGPNQAPYPDYFNAGVGGDKIANIIFRLTEKGLLDALKTAGVDYALLCMGTNDLVGDKKPVQQMHIEQYRLVVEALQWACPGIQILVCGLNPKKRVLKDGIVEESNVKLEEMVQELMSTHPDMTVEYMPSDPRIIDSLEDDGVHLNEEGYDLFAEALWTSYQKLRLGSGMDASMEREPRSN